MSIMPTLEAALRYVREDRRITVCRDKRPIGTNWQHKIYTPEELNELYVSEPSLNVGFLLGPASGVIDIESDDGDQEAVVHELFPDGVPRTPTFRSVRGWHRLFRYSDRLAPLGGVYYYDKLGIRIGAGGKAAQSVVPPSAGRVWEISPDECEFAELPAAVIDKLLASQQRPIQAGTADKATSGSAVLAAMRRITIADQNDGSRRLYVCCCRCVEHDLSDEATLDAIHQIATERPFPRVWSDTEILARLRDAERECERGKALRVDLTTPEGRTDAANAGRLVAKHGDSLRWCDPWKKWLVWDGKRWAVDNVCRVAAMMKDVAKSLWTEIACAQ